MKLQCENHRHSEAASAAVVHRFAGVFILLETIIAAMVVVGVFAAASQPLSWSSVVQYLLCAGLALLLWLADSKLDTDEHCAVPVSRQPGTRQQGTGSPAYRPQVQQES